MFNLDELREIQKAYWKFDSAEYAALQKRTPNELSWSEKLRLHHLHILKLLSDGVGKKMLMDGDAEAELPIDEDYKLAAKFLQELASKESPYRARHCAIWQLKTNDAGPQRNPDMQGVFRNASLTHLGALEIIRLDANNKPIELTFVPLDDVGMLAFASPALFRAARIFYDNGRGDEIVLMPLLYGVSWLTSNHYDQDGSFTRFCCHIKADALEMPLGVGIGHQDFNVEQDKSRILLGLGTLAQIAVALEADDPRFDQKCLARGIDPDAVRRQFPKQ
jgi:hypothetical protein